MEIRPLLKQYMNNSWIQLGVLAAFLLLYVFTKISIFGILFAAALVLTVAVEMWLGGKNRGWKEELKDTAVSLLAIVAFWFILSIILNSSVPINAVVSCSMLPNVERGDLILVQGAEPLGYEVNLTSSEVSALNSIEVPLIVDGKGELTVNGSIYSYCAQFHGDICTLFVNQPELFHEKRGPFTFNYGSCTREKGEIHLITPCVTSVDLRSQNYIANFSHDTIVYSPPKGDLYSYTGDIIHRVYFKINDAEDGKTYYLTKGDNNPIFDIQVYDYSVSLGNTAPSDADYRGKILFRIPVLGYPKLFISGFFSETTNCDSSLVYPYSA